jgi:GntR family transcriptional regulator
VDNSSIRSSLASGTHLYKEIEQQLTLAIRQGEYKPGDALPAEKALAQRFDVSIGTLRKSVDNLVAKGVLIRQQGRGTFVSKHGKDRYLFAFFHVLRQDGSKVYPVVTLQSFTRMKADKQIAKRLDLATGSRVIQLVNILQLHGRPVLIDEIYVPEHLFPGLTQEIFSNRPSTLYQLYQDRFGLTVVKAEERLRAVKADNFKALTLGLQVGDPLLQVIRLARSFNNLPVEMRYSFINTTDYEYFADAVVNA